MTSIYNDFFFELLGDKPCPRTKLLFFSHNNLREVWKNLEAHLMLGCKFKYFQTQPNFEDQQHRKSKTSLTFLLLLYHINRKLVVCWSWTASSVFSELLQIWQRKDRFGFGKFRGRYVMWSHRRKEIRSGECNTNTFYTKFLSA